MKNFHGRISFWLVPNERHKAIHQKLIDQLALRYTTANFIPHLTVFSAPYSQHESYNRILKDVANNLTPITLSTTDIGFSDKFTKTLYLQFEPSRKLNSLNKKFADATSVKSNYILKPHLSLAYGSLKEYEQKKLLTEIEIPRKKIIFDQLKAISTQTHVHSARDVKDWFEIASVDI